MVTSVSSDHEIFAHVNLALSLFENYRESMFAIKAEVSMPKSRLALIISERMRD
jgi:hypothetical protein